MYSNYVGLWHKWNYCMFVIRNVKRFDATRRGIRRYWSSVIPNREAGCCGLQNLDNLS